MTAARANPTGVRHFLARRTLWHTAGWLLAGAVVWLVFRAYGQPEFMLDFLNMSLC